MSRYLMLAAAIATLSLPAASVQQAGPVFSPDRIRADVAYLADDKLEGRFTIAPGYYTAAAYVATRFAKLGMTPGGDVQQWFQLAPVRISDGQRARNYKAPNVIGIIPGTDPALKNEYVLLTAHLDGVGKGSGAGDTINNGAMDNASGVATMLEVARAFAADAKRPRRSLMFVATAAEEHGLLGSKHLARNPLVKDGKVVANVNLDMPNLLYDFTDVIAFGAESSTMGATVERAAAKLGVALSPDPMPQQNLFQRSDHYSFVQQGVPSIFLVTGFKNGGDKAFRSFEAAHYHGPTDDMNLPFNWNAAAKFAQLNYLIVRDVADDDRTPMWYSGDTYGDRFAPKAPKAPKPRSAKP